MTPSNEVLKTMIDNINEKLDGHTSVHSEIFALLKEIQREMRESNGWKNKFLGALGVIIVVVVPLMSWALWQVSNIDSQITMALSKLELEIVE